VVGAEQNLSFLLRCLQLDDTRIKIRVLKILGESEQLSLRHEVIEFLTDADEQVLLAALRYIQKKGDLSVLSKITHLAHSKKKKVRQGVISTMFKIMKDMLIQQFDTFSDAKREKMVEWLMKMKPTFFEDIAYLSESLKEEDRIKYLKLLGSQMLSKALEDYRRLARDPQPKIRASAIRGFARIKDDESRFKLARPFFDDEDGRVRANAIELLPEARPSQKGMIDLCRRAARSTVRREKANAIARLLNWGFSEYEAALIEMLDSEDEWTKTSGLWVLGVTDLPHLTDRLRQGANDPRAPVREMAVRGIGIKGTEEDLRALMPFLQDPSRAVRVAAQKALRTRLRLSFEIA
jgi:HEAT repeat protein